MKLPLLNTLNLLLLGSLAGWGTAADAPAPKWDEREYLIRTSELVPTTKWLGEKQYAAGKLSVLMISGEFMSFEQHGRKLAELKRALNLDLEFAVAAHFMAEKGGPVVDNARISHLLASRKWDVIALYSMPMAHSENDPFELLSKANIKTIMEKVEAGDSGLLVVSGGIPEAISTTANVAIYPGHEVMAGLGLLGRIPRQSVAKWTEKRELAFADDYVHLTGFSNGRALVMNQTSLGVSAGSTLIGRSEAEPVTASDRIDTDYFVAEFARALMYAADKEPEVIFSSSPPGLLEVPFDSIKQLAGKWRITAAGDPRDLNVSWRLRDPTGIVIVKGAKLQKQASGDFDVPYSLPTLAAGSYYLDVFIDSDRGRENFGYSVVRVAAPCATAVTFSHPAFEPDVAITGKATATGALPTDQIKVSLWDGEQRRVAEAIVNVATGDFSFDTHDLPGIPHRVEAEVLRNGRRAGWSSSEINLMHRRQDTFNVVLWGGAVGPYAYWTQKTIWRTGVTSTMDPNGYLGNMSHVPFCGNLSGTWRGAEYRGADGTNLGKHIYQMDWEPATSLARTLVPAPWNDPVAWEEILGLTHASWAIGTKQPVLVYNLYDEGPYFVADTSPAGMTAYQTWLKKQYANDLAALNTEWKSSYKKWEEITDTLGQSDRKQVGDPWENHARSIGNYARWSDRQAFAKINFDDLVLDGFTRRAKTFDPQARIGFEGSGGFGGSVGTIADGMEFDDLLSSAGFYVPYDGIHLELIRSLHPPGFLYGFWIGYQKDAAPLLSKTWRTVVNGAPAIWWWMLPGAGEFHGWLARDDQPYPDGSQEVINECVKPLREGLGDLLLKLDQQHDGIALYYSNAAAQAGSMLPDPADNVFGSALGAADNWHQVIEDCSYQWLYLSKERVLAGDLTKRGIKLLILPMIQPLGEDEVAEMAKFAAAGGTIIADVRPGVLSGHCRVVMSGPADTLFGISRTGDGKALPVTGDFVLPLGTAKILLSVKDSRADSQIKATTATAHAVSDGTPLLLTRTIGKGQAILLNCNVEAYGAKRGTADGRWLRDFFKGVAGALNLSPRLIVKPTQGDDSTLSEVTTWKKGGVTLFSIFEGGGEGSATLPTKAFVFDWKRGALGQVDHVALDPLGYGKIQFLAAYAYDPGTPAVTVSKPQANGGDTLEFNLAMSGVPADETGVFSYHTRLLNPAGEWVDVLPWSAQGAGGKVTIRLRVALNDPAGEWTLDVREVTTGRKSKVTFKKL